MSKAYIIYRREKVYVTVDSYFQGGTGLMANVTAVTGFPFHSADVQAQGETFTAWACNGYRVRVDFVMTEPDPEPQDVRTLTALAYGNADLEPVQFGSREWFEGIAPIPW